MKILQKGKIVDINHKLNYLVFKNGQKVIFNKLDKVKVGKRFSLYVVSQGLRSYGFETHDELRLFWDLVQSKIWYNADEVYELLTIKNYKDIIKLIAENTKYKIATVLNIDLIQAQQLINALKTEYSTFYDNHKWNML